MKEYTFKRISTGKEFATVTGNSRDEAEHSITVHDIMDHEDYSWGDWQLIEVVEFDDEGDHEVEDDEELDSDPEYYR